MLSFRIIADPALAATSPAPGRDSSTGPYFHATTAGGRVQTTGPPSCLLGHRLERPGGGKPDGVFAAWSWDGSRLRVENDRYGFYPLYYFVRPGEICISPSIPALLAQGAPRDFDDAALAVFLRLGFSDRRRNLTCERGPVR